MPSTRDIRRRIKGVKNIRQVTKAMNMIAAVLLAGVMWCGCGNETSPPEKRIVPSLARPIMSSPLPAFVEQQFPRLSEKNYTQLALSREFICKLERLAPRDKAPGYWIDQTPATKPPFFNLPPVLDKQTLYRNKQAVLDHWQVFQKRYPDTTRFLEKFGYHPSLSLLGLPGEGADQPEVFQRYVENWYQLFRKYYRTEVFSNCPSYQAVGDCLLYVDFLMSRGDREDQKNACRLLAEPAVCIVNNLTRQMKSKEFGWVVGKEILWPMMSPNNEGCWTFNDLSLPLLARNAIENKLDGAHLVNPDYIRLCKWIRFNIPNDSNHAMCDATLWSNIYSAGKDYIGVFLCLHAGHADWRIDRITLAYMRKCLDNHFGKEHGDELFGEYLETLAKGKQTEIDRYRENFRKEMTSKTTKSEIPKPARKALE